MCISTHREWLHVNELFIVTEDFVVVLIIQFTISSAEPQVWTIYIYNLFVLFLHNGFSNVGLRMGGWLLIVTNESGDVKNKMVAARPISVSLCRRIDETMKRLRQDIRPRYLPNRKQEFWPVYCDIRHAYVYINTKYIHPSAVACASHTEFLEKGEVYYDHCPQIYQHYCIRYRGCDSLFED
jgi:hypothetical protein